MNILVYCPNWVGDVVMATPTFRALRAAHPEANIVGLVRPAVVDTLSGNPWFNSFICFHHRAPKKEDRTVPVIRKLRLGQFDLGLLMTNSLRSAILAALSGIKRRVGYAHEGRGFLLDDALEIPPGWKTSKQISTVDYFAKLVEHIGVPVPDRRLELFTTPADEAHADRFWRQLGWHADTPVVVLNPGAAYGSAKRWPSNYFAELARRLVDEAQVKVLVLCGPEERGFARYIADASLRPRQVHSLAEEAVSLGLAKAAVRRAQLLVSNDSGPRHFGAAFGVPVVSLFGPTHIGWTETNYPHETKLQKILECGPCQHRECPLGHLRCMKELTVDQVYRACRRHLENPAYRQAS